MNECGLGARSNMAHSSTMYCVVRPKVRQPGLCAAALLVAASGAIRRYVRPVKDHVCLSSSPAPTHPDHWRVLTRVGAAAAAAVRGKESLRSGVSTDPPQRSRTLCLLPSLLAIMRGARPGRHTTPGHATTRYARPRRGAGASQIHSHNHHEQSTEQTIILFPDVAYR